MIPVFVKRKVLSLSCGINHCAAVVVCQDGSNDTEVFAWGDGSNGKLGNLIEDVRTRTRTPSDGRLTNESCHARYAAHSHSHNRHQCESRISMAARPSRCIAARSSLPC